MDFGIFCDPFFLATKTIERLIPAVILKNKIFLTDFVVSPLCLIAPFAILGEGSTKNYSNFRN